MAKKYTETRGNVTIEVEESTTMHVLGERIKLIGYETNHTSHHDTESIGPTDQVSWKITQGEVLTTHILDYWEFKEYKHISSAFNYRISYDSITKEFGSMDIDVLLSKTFQSAKEVFEYAPNDEAVQEALKAAAEGIFEEYEQEKDTMLHDMLRTHVTAHEENVVSETLLAFASLGDDAQATLLGMLKLHSGDNLFGDSAE